LDEKSMKIAVYTIALNEEQFVERWYESAKEADYLLIADTGSTDGTIALAKSLGINVVSINIVPWRFDDARNAAMAALPKDIDYCIALDMDEIFVEGWRKHLEGVTPGITRPRYKYTWSWNADGSEGLTYGGDKIHHRQGYRWTHPVHEVMRNYAMDETQEWIGLEIHHYPDNTKSRSQYFPLLEMAVREDPHDDRNAHYLGREYYFYGFCDKAKEELMRHLTLPNAVWKPERAASMRYIARCSEGAEREHWLRKAYAEHPIAREAIVELAEYFYEISDWTQCREFALKALEIKERPLEYLNDPRVWGALPHDLAAISSYHLGFKEDALTYGKEALTISPDDERLKKNVEYYSL
jgi:glycosyltransferase involved in cell wall biosynthesis